MSLINEALKKAQRARQEGAPNAADHEPGGPVVRRAKPKSARSMLLMGVAAVVLVVGSMIGTAVWLTRAPDAPDATPKAPVAVVTEPAADLPAITPHLAPARAEPATVTPIAVTLPPQSPTVAPAASELGSRAGENVAEPRTPPAEPLPVAPVASSAGIPAKAGDTAEASSPPVPERGTDERVHKFVEAIRVMGIRSSGAESKVLMNDRVYRVNDVVDRSLSITLIKVAPDSLTFTDATGALYVKNF